MRRASVTTIAFCLLLLLGIGPASAEGRSPGGSCSGPGHWRLDVARETATSLRVRFRVRDVEPGETWQLFLSDNGVRIYAGTRIANDEGRFRVRTITRDRGGSDRIRANAVNVDTGASCAGSIRY
jgi:hypothetical protein